MGPLGGWRRPRLEVGRDGVDVVVFRADGHGSRAALRCDGLNHGVFIGRIFMSDGDGAIAARGKRELR
jgi:hypothetical protein